MIEIKSEANIKSVLIGKPLPTVMLDIDFDDIAKQLDELHLEKFPRRFTDAKVILVIRNSKENRIFGYPVEFKVEELEEEMEGKR